jgi:hypothetical protein
MGAYNTNNQLGGTPQAISTAFKTIVALTAATATLTSAKLVDFTLGADTAPADNVINWDVSRQTAAGTSTAVTPLPADPTVRAAGTVTNVNFTAEGTITANSSQFVMALNQRASFRWVAAPGSELIIPNTNLAGFAIRAKSPAYTGTVVCNAGFVE